MAVTADNKARRRCYRRSGKLVQDQGLRRIVIHGLRKQWSPAQISAKLKIDYPGDERMRVCAETLYTYLYVLPRGSLRQSLLRCLRQHRKARRPRSRGNDRRGRIPEMFSIEERPAQVADRAVPGHWEGDLSLGARHQSALGTLVERTHRTVLLVRLKRQDAETVRKAQDRLNGRPRNVLNWKTPFEAFNELLQ